MNKHLPLIIVSVIGAIVGAMVGSGNPAIKLLGIAIVATIIFYFRKELVELFLETEADKVVFLLFAAVIGAGVIIIDSTSRFQWQMGLSWAWGAWTIFCILLLRKLSQLISYYEFALEIQKANTKQLESKRYIIKYLEECNKELHGRLDEIEKESNTEPKKKKQAREKR